MVKNNKYWKGKVADKLSSPLIGLLHQCQYVIESSEGNRRTNIQRKLNKTIMMSPGGEVY